VDTAKKHKIYAGIHTGSTKMAKEMIALGFQYVTLLADNAFLASGAKAAVQEMREGGQKSKAAGVYLPEVRKGGVIKIFLPLQGGGQEGDGVTQSRITSHESRIRNPSPLRPSPRSGPSTKLQGRRARSLLFPRSVVARSDLVLQLEQTASLAGAPAIVPSLAHEAAGHLFPLMRNQVGHRACYIEHA